MLTSPSITVGFPFKWYVTHSLSSIKTALCLTSTFNLCLLGTPPRMSLLTSWLLIQSRLYASPADENILSTQSSTLTGLGRRVPGKAFDAFDSGADLLLDTTAALLASEAVEDGWADRFAVEA